MAMAINSTSVSIDYLSLIGEYRLQRRCATERCEWSSKEPVQALGSARDAAFARDSEQQA